jgi:eukaryotic-like serine/threonine-protein kinase
MEQNTVRSDPATRASDDLAAMLSGTPYRFIAPLERGGMGEVVEAEHIRLGKRVVIKLLQRQFAGRPDLVDRMRIEAQALARITHPNLVLVTDFGQTRDGQTYLVMERLYGQNLRQYLKAHRFVPVIEAIGMVREALSGLSAVHAAGIVHRDVKLENIFLCHPRQGQAHSVKLLDFGIAKIVECVNECTPAPLAFPTAEGVRVGTPRFFSPEQARGRPVDQRTDVYAAGIVLYTLIAGHGPFEHIHALYQIARAHALEVPEPPSRYAPQAVSPEVDRAILKALAKRPDDRFQTAQAFAEELARIAGITPVDQALPSNPASRWQQTEVIALAGAEASTRLDPIEPTHGPDASPPRTVRIPGLAEQQDAWRRALEQQKTCTVAPVEDGLEGELAPPQKSRAGPPVVFLALVLASTVVSAVFVWLLLVRFGG